MCCGVAGRNFLITLYLSQLDLVTDILYYRYSTFAYVYLEYLALLFTVLPTVLLMLVGLLCYGALPSGQFAYCIRLHKVHLLVMYLVELPLMLLLLGWDTSMNVCASLWQYRRQHLTQENVSNILLFLLFKVVLFVIFVTVHAVVAVVISLWMLFLPLVMWCSDVGVYACLHPRTCVIHVVACWCSPPSLSTVSVRRCGQVWGIMVLLRLYILWPTAWLVLRRVFHWSLSALRKPGDQRVLAWGPRPSSATNPAQQRAAKEFVALAIGFLFSASAEREANDAANTTSAADHADVADDQTSVSEETQFFVMSVTLLFEFCVEAVPQISLQAYNNTQRDSWTPFAIASIVVSGYIALEGIFRLLVMKCA